MMRNDICFPCMESPSRCLFLSIPTDDDEKPQTSLALGCNRQGKVSMVAFNSHQRRQSQEWCLVFDNEDDARSGIYKIVNAAHNTVLVCQVDLTVCAQKSNDPLWVEDSVFWSIQDDPAALDSNQVRLRSLSSNGYLSRPSSGNTNSGLRVVIPTGDEEDASISSTSALWRMEYQTGELCYIQLAHPGPTPKLLLCDNLGSVKISSVWGGWEVWRFVEAGDGRVRISSWTHQHRLLACTDHGRIRTTEDRTGRDTLWTVRRAPKGLEGVLIAHVATGRLLRSEGTRLGSAGYIDGVRTTWQLTAAHRQRFHLSSIPHDRRISLVRETVLKMSHHRRDCEVWCLERLEDGFVRLRSEKFARFLRYDGRGLSVTEDDPVEKETNVTVRWRIVESPAGNGVCIVSAMEPFLALSCGSSGQLLEAVDRRGPDESWILEPCMPDSLKQWQINLMIGGAVGAALLGPAIAVGAAGMMAEGGGVAAAASMAVAEGAAATATGEIVLASAAVAAPSAGMAAAAGLGIAGITAAMGTGAAVGLSATGIVVATFQPDRREGTDLKQTEQDRPFCEWRVW